MKNLAVICFEKGFIDQGQLDALLQQQAREALSFEAVLLNSGYINDEQLAEAIGIQLGLAYTLPLEITPDPELLKLLSPRQAERYRAVPIQKDEDRLVLATDKPLNLESFDNLSQLLNCRIKITVASTTQVSEALKKHYGSSSQSVAAVLEDLNETDLNQYESISDTDVSTIAPESMANEAPIIRRGQRYSFRTF